MSDHPESNDHALAESDFPVLYLKRGEDRRLRAGHLWVFSNEVDTKLSPLNQFQPGEPVVIAANNGKAIGSGYVNPNSLICARLVDRQMHVIDRSLVTHRLNVALALRERLYREPYYRLVYGESDGLPGLTVDRFDDVLVAQATTAGMERLREEIDQSLIKVLKPRSIVWKNDSSARGMEQLGSEVLCSLGDMPSELLVQEGEQRFEIDVSGGQKTGWFYDQRANRELLLPLVKGARVLDLFSYVGAWGVRAAAAGAEFVTCVDASADAVKRVERNAELNAVSDRLEAVKLDAFDFLRNARAARRHWDIVIVDPPAFVKRKKDFKEGALAYRRINEAAMQVLARDGLLVSASCSYHMSRSALLEAIQAGARHLDRQVQVIAQLQQSADHPLQAAIAETEYLKGFLCRVLPA
ncbi:class I SAM-dependent rRNA methyltransferase [Pseudomarimonas arenosa]|uniref:Class I SAM-dependent rRNA methyltransferase n=1 Tax=Pseudomarimonas arenosa TaxID=2774145 RepID=A0AAW3ZKE0_9GAMM|nr:class I SAM-dependent rRNA methyltransferase [Pseudomarimonas arenosa]MBD8526593.1 class I SAM-dependent rRNA methyltransferase [Pseudomarimonas arenosa]